jgi:hypothetical protein
MPERINIYSPDIPGGALENREERDEDNNESDAPGI